MNVEFIQYKLIILQRKNIFFVYPLRGRVPTPPILNTTIAFLWDNANSSFPLHDSTNRGVSKQNVPPFL